MARRLPFHTIRRMVRLSVETNAMLEERARAAELSVSDLVRAAINTVYGSPPTKERRT